MPLPVARKVHALAALHRQRRHAAHLIAVRDAAGTTALSSVYWRCDPDLLENTLRIVVAPKPQLGNRALRRLVAFAHNTGAAWLIAGNQLRFQRVAFDA